MPYFGTPPQILSGRDLIAARLQGGLPSMTADERANELLGIDPLQLDTTPIPQTPDPRFIESFAGFQPQQQAGPASFLGGLVSGVGQGLGAAGTRAQAARLKLEADAQTQRKARDAANLQATRDYRQNRAMGLRSLSADQRTERQKEADFERDNPVVDETLVASYPGLSALPRMMGQRISRELLQREALQPPAAAGDFTKGMSRAERLQYEHDLAGARASGAAGPGGKPPTPVQQQATAFYNRALDAVNTIAQAPKGGKSIEDKIAASGTYAQYGLRAPNVMQSGDQRAITQAKRVFATAILRKESGAAINQGEYDSIDKAYFVQPGDDVATIEQKRHARQVALEGMKFTTGASSPETPAVDPASFWRAD